MLRHELGHSLGFVHDHIRPECLQSCGTEDLDSDGVVDEDWRAVTAYDVDSVMHYQECGGNTAMDSEVTPLDGVGAMSIYGMSPTLFQALF